MTPPKVNEVSEFQIFRSILYYCCYIIFLPILSFFFSKIILFHGILGMNDTPSNIYAAIIAILVVHGALGVFIWRAHVDAQKVSSKTD